MRRGSFAWALALGLLMPAALPALKASGANDPPLPIRVEAVAGCPDAPKLATDTNAALHREGLVASDEPAPVRIVVEFAQEKQGYSATIRVVGGARAGFRTLADPGAKCDDLAQAVAVTLALMLDEGLVEAAPSSSASASSAPAASSAPPIASSVSAPIRDELPKPPAPVQSVDKTHVALTAGGGVAFGIVRSAAPYLSGGLELTTEHFRFGASALGIVPQRFTVVGTTGTVDVSWLAGGLFGCARFVRSGGFDASACGEAMLGSVRARTSGLDIDGNGNKRWLALAPALHVRLPIFGALSARTRAALIVPLGQRPAFDVRGAGLVYEPPSVAFSLGADLILTIH